MIYTSLLYTRDPVIEEAVSGRSPGPNIIIFRENRDRHSGAAVSLGPPCEVVRQLARRGPGPNILIDIYEYIYLYIYIYIYIFVYVMYVCMYVKYV